MSLIIHGGRMESAACCELRSERADQVVENPAVAATLNLEVEDAFLEFENAQSGGRPYLMLMGRPSSVQGDFPFNISEMHYDGPFDRSLIAYRYDFTRENLADLSMKGLYEPGFEPPEIIRRNTFELPCTVACAAMGPVSKDDIPVIFASLNQSSLRCTDETSGYEISEYFEMMPVQAPDYGAEHDETQAARRVLYDKAHDAMDKAIATAVPAIREPSEDVAESEADTQAAPQDGAYQIQAGAEPVHEVPAATGRGSEAANEIPGPKPVVKRNAFNGVSFENEPGDEDEFLTPD